MKYKLIISSLVLIFIGGCKQKSFIKEIKLAHGLSQDHAVHKGMVDFAQRVFDKSDGTLEIKIYANGQLGSESQCLELLQIGSLGITKVSAAVMESFAPKYKILSIPYIFANDKHRYAVYDGDIGLDILNSGQEFWLKGLCFFDAGSRSFYTTNKPIRSASDVQGLKIRVMKSITSNKMISEMGGSPVPIDWGELYTALQQGVVDGAENNPPSFHLSRHYEICKYYTLDRHTAVPDVMVISTIVWNQLSEKQQDWISSAAKESVAIQRNYWAESEAESMRIIRASGVEVIEEPDIASFKNASRMIVEEFRKDEQLSSLIERINNMDEKID